MADALSPRVAPSPSVRFVPAGRRQSFLLPELGLDRALVAGDAVVVADGERLALGHVVREAAPVAERRAVAPESSARVLRRASDADLTRRLHQQYKERQAFQFCLMRIRERGLDMKLTRVEHAFDDSRLLFYYTADERVDFRELVRDLAAAFRMRIEMRQISVRDATRMLGGYGPCGRPLCCTTWLTSFAPVSIKMAKLQGLTLSPSKLSGVCGRLKCCLRYELPNGRGERHAGCAHEGACEGGCSGDGACGTDGCTCKT